MTINEAIYQTLDGVNISTDDFPAGKRFVYGELKNARTELLKQELNKNSMFQSAAMQLIECYFFDRVDSSNCDECASGEYLLKGRNRLPETIDFNGGQSLYLYTMLGKPIDMISRKDIHSSKNRRFKLPDSFGFYINNGYPYISGYDDIDNLATVVEGHFRDPEIVLSINAADDCPSRCKPIYELEFVCPGLIDRRVIEMARSVILRKLNVPSDNTNNSKFDTDVQSKNVPES
jgi:hypothetical protein